MNESLRAAILAGAISVEPQPIDPFALRVKAIRRVIHQDGAPLNLDDPYFRYRVERDGTVRVLPALDGARVCREKSGRHRLRSVARS